MSNASSEMPEREGTPFVLDSDKTLKWHFRRSTAVVSRREKCPEAGDVRKCGRVGQTKTKVVVDTALL